MRAREWGPPFFLGLGCAVAAEMAHGLLLYSTRGFLEALTIVLAVQFGAFAMGVATRPRDDRVSRTWRWLIGAGCLAIAGMAAFVWSVAEGVTEVPGSRGTTLVVFGALPMYGFGLVFGGIRTHLRGEDGRMWPGQHRGVAAPAFIGAAIGVVLVGVLLLSRLTPLSIYMFSLLCLASAAMVEGGRRQRTEGRYLAIPPISDFAPDP